MKNLVASIAVAAAVVLSNGVVFASNEDQTNAENHGYATAALEVVCEGLTVTNPKLRATLDRKYRDNAKLRPFYLDGYQHVVNRHQDQSKSSDAHRVIQFMTCVNPAVEGSGWLKLDPVVRSKLENRARQ